MSRIHIKRILATHRIRKLTADEVLSTLKATPLVLAPGAGETAAEHVVLLLPQTKLLDQQLRDVSRRIRQILAMLANSNLENGASLSDASLILPFPELGLQSHRSF